MIIFRDKELYGDVILLSMTPDEYGMMCEFMKTNGIGYGRNRSMSNQWRDAKEEFDKRKKAK